jgi:trehalose utilization protein
MTKNNTNAFIISVKQVLHKYGLPNIQQLIQNTPCKMKWKATEKETIWKFWENIWREEKL